MVFFERFLAPKNSNFGIENDVFCECILASLGICWALVFGRFSLRLSSEIQSFRASREKGADGFRLVKTNVSFRIFHVREAAGRAARQATEYKNNTKLPTPKLENQVKLILFGEILAVSTPVAKRRAKMSPRGFQNGGQSGPRDPP